MVRCLTLVVFIMCAALGVVPDAYALPAGAVSFFEIPAAGDSFVMGDGTLGPNVSLTISHDFFMSRFPITNSQFGGFINDCGYDDRSYWTANGWKWKGRRRQPSCWTERQFNGPDQPVVGVCWYEAVAFCNWMSLKDGLDRAYDDEGRVDFAASGYRLPTEAEWEYAAAKGAPGQAERIFPWGDKWDPMNVVCSVAPAKARCTATVGSRSPQGDTPQGLADMSGNVWQWCSDNMQSEHDLSRVAQRDRYYFRGDSTSESMVLRGASWYNFFENGYRSAFRGFSTYPGNGYDVFGFRIVRRSSCVRE